MEYLGMKKKTGKKKAGAKKKKAGSRKKKEMFKAALSSLREDLTRVAAIVGITIGHLDDNGANGLAPDRAAHQNVLKEIAERFQA